MSDASLAQSIIDDLRQHLCEIVTAFDADNMLDLEPAIERARAYDATIPLDTETSLSRQHHIDTGRYLADLSECEYGSCDVCEVCTA